MRKKNERAASTLIKFDKSNLQSRNKSLAKNGLYTSNLLPEKLEMDSQGLQIHTFGSKYPGQTTGTNFNLSSTAFHSQSLSRSKRLKKPAQFVPT